MTRRTQESTLTDIACEVLHETPNAYRIFDGKTTEWVPKSQVELNDNGTCTMPLWLAKEKGFV